MHERKQRAIISMDEQMEMIMFNAQRSMEFDSQTERILESLETNKRDLIAQRDRIKEDMDRYRADHERKNKEEDENIRRMIEKEEEDRRAREKEMRRLRKIAYEHENKLRETATRSAVKEGFQLKIVSAKVYDDGYTHTGIRRLWIEFTTDPIVPGGAVRHENTSEKMVHIYGTRECKMLMGRALRDSYPIDNQIPKDMNVLGIMNYGYYHPKYLGDLNRNEISILIEETL